MNIKSKEFYQFSEQINKLLEVAEQMDQEVADAIMAQREYFLDHHESLRIEDWKAKLQGLLVELKNSIPLLEVIADVLEGLDTIFESLKDSIKHWYECGGGKYIVDVVKSIGGVALAVGFLAVAIGALALPTAGIFAICGVIGAGIAVVNSVTNVATSFRAADAALDGDPAWARIYGKQDKLSDVLRQTNFGNGTFNQLSNFSAGAIDATEVICDVVGVAEMGKNVVKLFKGDAFKLLKNKGGISYSDLKNGVKSGIVDLKSTIKQSYKDLKYGIKGNVKVDSVAVGTGDAIKSGSYSNFADGMSAADRTRYIESNEKKFFDEFTKRANSSGLDSTQISEAYNAMKSRDYAKMASYFDTSSPNNGAVFWSGNKEGAAAYAAEIRGTIMEQTPGGEVYDNWRGLQGMYPEWDTNTALDQKPIWTALSRQYAKDASGNVVYAVKEGYENPKSVWKTVEYPILEDLLDDGIVTSINTVILRSK